MWKSLSKRMPMAAAAASTAALAVSANVAVAAPIDAEFVAGDACAFALAVEGPGAPKDVREFEDANGRIVRTLQAGRGSELTFTNLQSGATLSLPSNGSVTNTVFDDDGSATVTLTGHTVLIMFPTDVPPGPSTTLYVGRVVFTVDPAGVFTILSTSGRSVDICEALS